MAAEYVNTLAGLLQLNNKNVAEFEVTDLLQDAPLLAALYAQPATQQTAHSYLKETVAAGAAFRAVNSGLTTSASKDLLVEVTLAILDGSFSMDKALAIAYRKGRDAFMAREMVRHLRSAIAQAEAQIMYGTGNDATGFSGLANAAAIDKTTDDMVVDATGSNSGAVKTSVFLIRSGESECSLIAGQDGNLDIGEIFEFQKDDGTGKVYPALGVNITGWLGLQLGSAYSIGRICNITNETGKGLTDSLLSQALERFPAARPPTLIVMHRKARGQWQRSRTATSETGKYAELPKEFEGIPVIVSDAVSTSETLLST